MFSYINKKFYSILFRIFIILLLLVFYIPLLLFIKNKDVLSPFIIFIHVVYLVFTFCMSYKTKLGVKTLAEIKGFRMYLKTAEEHRLNILTPPERTPELFEQMLPYAIALDVENQWANKFDSVLKAASYNPDWYDSDNKLEKFNINFYESFDSSIRDANILSLSSGYGSSGGRDSGSGSWSSGSGGGGSSGGGGGGGGGGGW